MSYSSARPDLIPSVVAPMVAEAAAGAVGDAREGTSQVAKYWARLKDVRAKRHAMDEALKAAAGGPEQRSQTEMYTKNCHLHTALTKE